MKYLTKWCATLLTVSVVLALAVLAAPLAPADDKDGPPGRWAKDVIPPTSKKAQQTYEELAAAWWNWVGLEPPASNPLLDDTGEDCDRNQPAGPVWFLAGTRGGSATRKCTVPAGKHLFFPVINAVFWVPEDGDTEEEVRDIANFVIDNVTVVECSIDGKPVKNLSKKHRVETPGFTLSIVEGGLYDGVYEPGDRYPAVADGYWVLVSPLEKGKHKIHFKGTLVIEEWGLTFTTEVTYHLTVEDDDD